MEVGQLLGTQGFWQHQVLNGVGDYSSRKYSALEGHTVLASTLHYSCLENPLLTENPGRPQSTGPDVLQFMGSQRAGHDRSDPVCIDA